MFRQKSVIRQGIQGKQEHHSCSNFVENKWKQQNPVWVYGELHQSSFDKEAAEILFILIIEQEIKCVPPVFNDKHGVSWWPPSTSLSQAEMKEYYSEEVWETE